MKKEVVLARISVLADEKLIVSVIDFVRDISARSGLDSSDEQKLELVIEEACKNVISGALDPGEESHYDVVISRRPGCLVIGIEDQGIPFDFAKLESAGTSHLSQLLAKSFADEIHYYNLGKNGKRVEILKNLPYRGAHDFISAQEKAQAKENQEDKDKYKDVEISLRLMTGDDAVSLARCVYRSYGYSYDMEAIYYPEKVKELLDHRHMVSCVAVEPGGEVIGHLTLGLDTPNARIGEAGKAVVDPRFRGRSLFKLMKQFLVEWAKENDFYGIYSESVTVHPYTQKGNIAIGASETGVLLAFSPATMSFKEINEDLKDHRRATILYYLKVNEDPERKIYLPGKHKDILLKIYEKTGLSREFHDDARDEVTLGEKATVDLQINSQTGRGFLRVTAWGEDLLHVITYRLHELCLQKIDCIYLDLPLSSPAIQRFCPEIEKMGFFFSGVIPELFNDDSFRLQYLNNVEVIAEDIKTASDFGRELVDYVLDAQKTQL